MRVLEGCLEKVENLAEIQNGKKDGSINIKRRSCKMRFSVDKKKNVTRGSIATSIRERRQQ